MSLQFYDENIPCLAACPVHTNAGAYVAAIADGDRRPRGLPHCPAPESVRLGVRPSLRRAL